MIRGGNVDLKKGKIDLLVDDHIFGLLFYKEMQNETRWAKCQCMSVIYRRQLYFLFALHFAWSTIHLRVPHEKLNMFFSPPDDVQGCSVG